MFGLFKKKTKNSEVVGDATNESTGTSGKNTGSSSDVVEPYFVSDEGKVRYEIEHRILKQLFYENPMSVAQLATSNDGLWKLYNDVYRSAGVDNPYKPADFSHDTARLKDTLYIISIVLPKPSYQCLCYRIHLILDSESKVLGYYTIERGKTEGFLCYWDGDQHVNIGRIKDPGECDGMRKAMEATVIYNSMKERYEL